MKKIIISLVVCAVMIGFSACYVKCRPPKPPQNLKLIDCEDFNDVATVYWHLQRDCEYVDGLTTTPPCDTLWIEGWGRTSEYTNYITLCPDSISAATTSTTVERASHNVNLYVNMEEGVEAVAYYRIACDAVQYLESCCSYNQHYMIILKGNIVVEKSKKLYKLIKNN